MGTQPQQILRWPLTSRDGELDDFAKAWAGRRCRGVVIYGPAGVGKSRLAEECLARTVHAGWKGRRATASAAAAAVPLGAIAHLIPPGIDLSDPVTGFAAVAAALAGPRQDRQWAVWVDDLHLLDASSAVLLRQLIDARVVRLIGTIRTGEPVGEAVEALAGVDAVHRIDLEAFGQEQAQAVLAAALGGSVGRRTLRELCTASGGNVLYLRELVTGALASGTLASDGELWELSEGGLAGTPRLAELIEARLSSVDPAARPVLELLALAEPLPLADAQQAAPPGVLIQLEHAGLVEVTKGRRRATLQLAHPLYGEVLRPRIPFTRRRALLLEQVDRIRASGARRQEDTLRMATWSLAATGTADPEVLIQAAALARHANDYDQAAVLAEAAWKQEQSGPAALSYATALIGLVRHDEAEDVLLQAEALVPEMERPALVEARVNNDILQGRLLDAQRLLQDRREPRSQLSLATVLYFRGRFRDSLECCRPLLAGADTATAMDAAIFATSALLRLGLIEEATSTFKPLRRYISPGDGDQQNSERKVSLFSDFIEDVHAYARALSGDLRAAEEILTRQYEEAIARKEPAIAARRATGLGFVLMERGRPRSALNVLHSVATQRTHWNLFTQWSQANAITCAALLRQTSSADLYLASLPTAGDDLEACNNRLARAWRAWLDSDKTQIEQLLLQAAEETRQLGQDLHRIWIVHAMGRLGMADLAGPYWDIPAQGDFLKARLDYTRAIAHRDVELLTRVGQVFLDAGADLFAAEALAEVANLHHRGGRARLATAAASRATAAAARCEGARTPALTYLSTIEIATPLTAREREIAMLAAAGTASKEIADTLHLSVRTVDNHLQHTYTKLGVATRHELARALGVTPRRA
ncbi:LuxR family transcriptional regulator [Streptomyces sp. SKN60]|uniref:helix-turn-helix transcriptional regulator n=1 Tax=Streptomyces sp. SKN60 TaxID=2855506 RepID=UPI002245C3BB|nr:LuxR C-terminal-related transcriptional regulator [Streptomyces sp. SKN60]MCX2185031.1 LuxR family transcriptional regulator [Streptomyces sp. SKN60]